ncbi:DUF6250 domain-containing protein [Formosa haliotis]|uniref:DUF6250 domain-containing protein n=1 Tax=Formosa haliotis TaxID=1555194 RepID=UPI000825D0F5|nr:DUF6250 domain-containing protein [Formosa haliotis]
MVYKSLKLRDSAKTLTVVLIAFALFSCKDKKQETTIQQDVIPAEKTSEVNDRTLIFEENFESDLSKWQVEQMPGGMVEINNGKLEITDAGGCTVWLKEKFEGPIVIEYDVFLIKDGGPYDRVSDLNCFWMAKDPEHPDNLFANSEQRGGKFSNYDSLRLYYMGVGGNDNGTTRFRRYTGTGERPLLPEHDLKDAKYMLESNTGYHIKIVANGETIQYYRDNELFSDFNDPAPYTSGYFGFRTVKNHMTVDNFKVYSLKN